MLTELKPANEPFREELIKHIEDLLERARSGETSAVLVAEIRKDRQWFVWDQGITDMKERLAMAEIWKYRLLKAIVGE